ncbi:RNA-directed DNA polymerase, eukaryota, Reverse transcriptase zinc-binding domain protein [Artemisia annua]|uniref:RNA-directed DNA polymerase, eukaryota, Reverse transcriptase zinc-binding domain protein n=1 Tax=Artemisia annua TaxID=35608 RepID=A0A2U1NUK6_ARTAN|nr:RNA-directed DNA polymerase, eukaryota, Reverse transcriptase zinc-binding domain protein [Artemisia annua]
MEKGFLSHKGRGNGKGVKEKQGSSVHATAMDKNSGNKEPELNKSVIPDVVHNEVSSVLANDPSIASTETTNASTNNKRPGLNENNKESGSYAKSFKGETSKKRVNFRPLLAPVSNGADVAVSMESAHVVHERFSNTVDGFFLGKPVVYPDSFYSVSGRKISKNSTSTEQNSQSDGLQLGKNENKAQNGVSDEIKEGEMRLENLDMPMNVNEYTFVNCVASVVNIESRKWFKDKLIVQYRDKENVAKGLKTVNVYYVWKLGDKSEATNDQNGSNNEGFTTVEYRKSDGQQKNENERRQQNKEKESVDERSGKSPIQKSGNEKTWNLKNDLMAEMKRSVNKYAVLGEMDMEERRELNTLNDISLVDHGIERRTLCKELQAEKSTPWILLGDFSVTLKVEEHSAGGSNVNNDMQNFIDCVEKIEVEDVCSSGLFFIWIKSHLMPTTRIMKKLDRFMANEKFISSYVTAAAQFLPFVTSDHSLAVLTILKSSI